MDSSETIDHYERTARHYATLGGEIPTPFRADALRRLIELTAAGAPILEIGSGPGYDADYLEALGLQVRRTDATGDFIAIQAERGKQAFRVDVTADELGGPYGGVLALCVLMHVPRGGVGAVLDKVAAALLPGAGFLVSVREGTGETPPPAAMAFWTRDGFAQRLEDAGLEIVWDDLEIDVVQEEWLTYLARRP